MVLFSEGELRTIWRTRPHECSRVRIIGVRTKDVGSPFELAGRSFVPFLLISRARTEVEGGEVTINYLGSPSLISACANPATSRARCVFHADRAERGLDGETKHNADNKFVALLVVVGVPFLRLRNTPSRGVFSSAMFLRADGQMLDRLIACAAPFCNRRS